VALVDHGLNSGWSVTKHAKRLTSVMSTNTKEAEKMMNTMTRRTFRRRTTKIVSNRFKSALLLPLRSRFTRPRRDSTLISTAQLRV
jgi:hypothetical protein